MRDLRHEQAAAYPDLADWIAWLDLEGKRQRTLYGYTRELAPLLRAHPGKTIGEFTGSDVSEQIRLKPPRSRHITRSIYNGWFTWALEQRRIKDTPMFAVPKIRNPKIRRKEIFDQVEVALLESLPSPDGPLWVLLFKAGLRRGDARHLRRRHVDLNRARLAIYDGKGGKDALIPLPPAALAAVADLDLIERVEPDDYLWYTRPGGGPRRMRRTPIADTSFERWYRRGIEQAGVRYLNPHQTRHTYGWWLRDNKLDIEERQFLMRHDSINTTERYYGRMSLEDVAVKIAKLGMRKPDGEEHVTEPTRRAALLE